MKCKAGNVILFQKFKKWLFNKLQTEVYIDTDTFPDFNGKKEYIDNLSNANVIVPINQNDVRNQEILEARREKEKNAWAIKLEEQKKANETIQDKMIKAELRLRKAK